LELELLDELLLELELWFELELLEELLLEIEVCLELEGEAPLGLLDAGAAARSDRVTRPRGGSPIRSCLDSLTEGSTRRSSMGFTCGGSGWSSATWSPAPRAMEAATPAM
jgi:hypothetical protein